jgi:outer membrane protein OmpA-like peptidoglycan-associated protein
MLHASFGSRPSLLGRALMPALVFCVIPIGAAFAEPPASAAEQNLYVRVTREEVDISSLRGKHEVRMHAAKGTVLEVFHIDGDRYEKRDSNWYWVMLPEDQLGTRPVGWIRGEDVEIVPAPKATALASVATGPAADRGRSASSAVVALERPPVERTPVEDAPSAPTASARSVRMPDVVLNFEFNRSDLTAEAKDRLATAMALPKNQAQGLSVALEGHADWIGTEPFNDRLGLARAETVRRYLAEHLQIPADRISVVSYGENAPAASNATREGRAQNRRVVIKVGA